jgi:hypothetical protein
MRGGNVTDTPLRRLVMDSPSFLSLNAYQYGLNLLAKIAYLSTLRAHDLVIRPRPHLRH